MNVKVESLNIKLNEKLLKFAGFTYKEKLLPKGKSYKSWELPKDYFGTTIPDLVNSLDAQSKWLMPKLQNEGYCITMDAFDRNGFGVEIMNIITRRTIRIRSHESFSLAVALAVEKLIDSMDKETK